MASGRDRIRKKDYDEYDYLIGMDDMNIRNMKRVFGEDKDQKDLQIFVFCRGGKKYCGSVVYRGF